ncbi:hypothetical protein [Thermococcus thioreducens]|uniref:hypothetical protein n=1 Tax=Thermococcus thioreducens TaxID=277988 RepID=UPI000B2C9199|nr:hypothetical protein [Thermococcus thioreducens]
MDVRQARRLVKSLKTNLYYIRATRVSRYWRSVGKNLEEAINTVEELDRLLNNNGKGGDKP